MASRAETDKQNVQAFYDLMFNQCRPAEAIERYAGATYIQHNPHVGDGKQAFIDYFERMAARVSGEAGRVHPRRRRGRPRGPALPADLARRPRLRRDRHLPPRRRGKMVEHWDVLQVVPEHSENGNGMF